MEVLVLQVFVSLVLVCGSVLFFVSTVRRRDHEHADRLALLPVDDDERLVPHQPHAVAPAGPAPSARVAPPPPSASPLRPSRARERAPRRP